MPRKKEELIHKQRNDAEVIDFENFGVACSVLAYRSIKNGTCKYDNTPEGLEQFKKAVQGYFDFIVRANTGNEKGVCADVEGLCVSLGITRQTLLNYRSRSEEWETYIDFVKENILSMKKQFAFAGKIPPVTFVFDATNNHGYYNTSSFDRERLQPKNEISKALTFEDIKRIAKKAEQED